MRRSLIFATGLSVVATFGVSSVASAVQLQSQTHITVGSEWTARNHTDHGCQVDTFQAGNKFTSNYKETGTYSGGGDTLKMTWLTGPDKNQVITATWNATSDEYVGTGTGGGITGSWEATLKEGAVSGCAP